LRLTPTQAAFGIALLLGVATALHACGKSDSNDENDRSDLDPTLAEVEVNASIVSDEAGVVTVRIASTSPNTQLVHASGESRIKGAKLAFAPSSFDIDFDVSLEEGKSIATKANLTQLMGADATVLSTAPAVVVTWTYDQDTFVPFKLTIPAPSAPAGLVADASLVVLMIKNQVGKPKRVLGLLPASALQSSEGFVTFESNAYGVFQAVYVNKVPTAAAQVETEGKQESIGKISGVAPGAFQINSPTAELNGPDAVLAWDPADLADTYTVKLDASSAACANPYKTLTVTSLSIGLKNARTGDTYACVTANNAAGATNATNTGFKFKADVSPPATPAKPSTNGPTTNGIEAVFSWAAVADVGDAGLAYYQVEVGTSPGKADVFNGPVTTTTKKVIGFHGKTYYARVSAVDNLGNASEFSPVSAGVLIDSE
jgi:hypothetical protein